MTGALHSWLDGAGPAGSILAWTLKGSLLLLVALLLTRLLARRSAAIRHLVWAVALSGTLLLPAVSTLGPRLALPVLPAASPRALETILQPTEATPAFPSPAPVDRAAGPLASDPSSRGLTPLRNLLLGLALSLSGLLVAYLGFGLMRVAWVSRRARPLIDDPGWAALLRWELRRSGVRRRVDLRMTDSLAVPSTWGLLRPCILVPEEAAGWSNAWRRDVLVHELGHIQRCDWPLHLAARLACALYWFNPLVWMAQRRLALEAEHACDDRVLQSGASGTDYAQRLLDLSRRSTGKLSATAGLLAMARGARLSRRIDLILDPHQRRSTMKRFEVVFTASLSLLLLVGLGSIQLVEAGSEEEAQTGFLVKILEVPPEFTPLMTAAVKGDLAAAGQLLSAGADPREGVAGHGTPLLVAARGGHTEMVALLLDYGVDPEELQVRAPRHHGEALARSALGAAAGGGHLGVVDLLLATGARVDRAPEGDASPLMLAAAGGHASVMRRLLEYGADVNLVVPGDGTALIAAARSGQAILVELLLNYGADPNVEVEGDGTAMSVAVETDQRAVVEVLMWADAHESELQEVTVSAETDELDTVSISYTLQLDPLIEVAEAVAARELELAPVDAAGTTIRVEIADIAATGMHYEVTRPGGADSSQATRMVDLLLQAGADPNLAVPGDGTPLIAAARNGNMDMTRRLLDAGADVNGSLRGDGSPLIAAAANGHLDLVRLLLDHRADINMVVPGDENALIAAAANGHEEVVRYLLDMGADARIAVQTDGEVRTALSQAMRHGQLQVAELLREYGLTR